jgi:hypothetical protein
VPAEALAGAGAGPEVTFYPPESISQLLAARVKQPLNRSSLTQTLATSAGRLLLGSP